MRDLPMPGSPESSTHLALAVLGPSPALEQDAPAPARARPAAGDARPCSASKRLSATSARRSPRHAASGAAKPLRRAAQVRELEAARRATDASHRLITTLAGRREHLQARREVRRLADHRLLLGRACADQLTDHDQAGRDADSGRRASHPLASPAPPSLEHRQPGAHRPLGLVLVRLRPAEVGQHAVAHELRDVAAQRSIAPAQES